MPKDAGELSLEELIALKKNRGAATQFKTPAVEQEFEEVNPQLKGLAMTAPTPLTITSGMRSPQENSMVGGVPNSQHLMGNALDIRKEGDLTDSLERFKSSGYKVLNEGDHYHVEPAGYANPNKQSNQADSTMDKSMRPAEDLSLEELRELRRMRQGIPAAPPSITPAPLKGISGNPIWTGYRHFMKGATAGLSEPVAAGLSALTEKGIQGIDSVTQMAGEQPMLPERSIGDAYNYYRNKQKTDLDAMTQANPVSSVLGEVAGIMSPGGAYSQITKAVPKVIPALAEGGGTLMNLGKQVLSGGLSNTAYNQLDPEAEHSLPQGAEDFAIGAGTSAISPVLNAVGSGFKKAAPRLINELIKPAESELARGRNIGKEMVERKQIGSIGMIKKSAEKGLEENENKLQDLLKTHPNAGEKIDKDLVASELENLKGNLTESIGDEAMTIPGNEREIKKIDQFIDKIKGSKDLTAEQANSIKRKIYKKQNSAYLKTNPSFNDEINMAYARGLKNSIEETIPEVGAINKELSYYGRLNDAMKEMSAKGEKRGLSSPLAWRDLMLGGMTGALTHSPGLAATAGVGSALMNTMPGATIGAAGMDVLGNLLKQNVPFNYLGPVLERTNQMFQ